jgi:hypothetical protein
MLFHFGAIFYTPRKLWASPLAKLFSSDISLTDIIIRVCFHHKHMRGLKTYKLLPNSLKMILRKQCLEL